MNEISIAVISDLHCKHSKADSNDDTWLISDCMRKPINQHPVQSLVALIFKEKIKVDLLVCAGDISNKTDPQGLVTGWSFLEEIKDRLGAKDLIATLGNHDVDSRGIYNKYDHLDMPRKLKDNFPFDFNSAKKAYIADRFCFIDLGDILLFNFNSVHSHTNSDAAKESIITDDILESIKYELEKNTKTYKYKIAITHHHPIKHSNVGFKYKDGDFIEKGEKLIEILDSFDFQIFIHGHKHEPKLTNYNGMPVFASGSLSSITNLQETGSKNNFHIIKLKSNDKRGIIKSWEFTYGIGWSPARSKIKSEIGFGYKGDIIEYSNKIRDFFNSESLERMNNIDFLLKFPDFNYYSPEEQDKLISELKKYFDIVLEYATGLVKEIIKRT